MGMYTEFCLGFQFKSDMPDQMVEILKFMTSGEPEDFTVSRLLDPVFRTDRWSWMLMSGGSYYFDTKPVLKFVYDNITNAWHLTVWTNIKNYDNEIEHFLDWVAPYIDVNGTDPHYLGFTRYETCVHPTLVYLVDGEIVTQNIEKTFSSSFTND